MMGIPPAALALGLGGVMPFAAAAVAPMLGLPPFAGNDWGNVQLIYGLAILSFMSGCIWAFAAKDGDPLGYALSTLPALYGVGLMLLSGPSGLLPGSAALSFLALGYAMLLALDMRAARLGQTPPWWMALRLLLTALVIACLLVEAF